jgi:mannose-6-phosphate isomerase-like protein (cupin superfamily)
MPTNVISTSSAEHYKWGGADNSECDAWYLLRSETLTVIEELMPPTAKESRHVHSVAQQFFFVLEGELTMEVEHHLFSVKKGEGIEVYPGQAHQAMNQSLQPLRLIVTSQPPSHGDRREA